MRKPRPKSARSDKSKRRNFESQGQASETNPAGTEEVDAYPAADATSYQATAVQSPPQEHFPTPGDTQQNSGDHAITDTLRAEPTAVSADAEVERLLRAYRKGLITETTLEDQLQQINFDRRQRRSFTYTNISGFSYTSILGLGPTICSTEHEMVMHLLDEFRCGESFATEFLTHWIEVSDDERVRGGLRVVVSREKYHAQILEARLRELGGIPQCTLPAYRREKEMAFYSSTEMNDADKIRTIMDRLNGKDPATMLKPLTDAIDQIQEDQQSKELLRALLEDEMASGKWLVEAHASLSAKSKDRA